MSVSDLGPSATVGAHNDVIEFVYTVNFIRGKQSSSYSDSLELLDCIEDKLAAQLGRDRGPGHGYSHWLSLGVISTSVSQCQEH